MLSLLESPQDRKAAAGRGRHKTGLHKEMQVARRDRKLYENRPEEIKNPTGENGDLVKAYRRMVNLETIWKREDRGGPKWCPRARAIWRTVEADPERHSISEGVVQDWREGLPAKAQADIQKRVERTQKEIWAARRKTNNQEPFNDPRSSDRQMYKALNKAPGKPLAFVMQEDGQVTTDPEIVD